ncbi:MAG: hypothetical protein ABGY96_24000 [bacterium]|nr:hypothetical protein [Gammaproteobacteria bacterium]HIL96345.1 hypothetical protein [Pseudomonadales bacterium]
MEQMVKANGIDICYESFGDNNRPAVLFVMGHSRSQTGNFRRHGSCTVSIVSTQGAEPSHGSCKAKSGVLMVLAKLVYVRQGMLVLSIAAGPKKGEI